MESGTFHPDEAGAWPGFQHAFEAGGRKIDCHQCYSPRMFSAGGVRQCASCGWSCQLYRCTYCTKARLDMTWAQYKTARKTGEITQTGEQGHRT